MLYLPYYGGFMTLTQTVDITADRRVRFDFEVPSEIPEGKTLFEFKVIPFVKKIEKPSDNEKIRFTREELDEMVKNCPITHKDFQEYSPALEMLILMKFDIKH